MRPKKSTLLGADGGPCCSSERSRTAPIAPELIDPGSELVSVEPQILPELHVGNAVRPRPLVEPAHRYSQEVRGFLNCQPGHRDSQSPLSRGAAVSLNGKPEGKRVAIRTHDRMSLTRLRESTSQARDFRLATNERHQGGEFPGASRCRGATTGRCRLQRCANGHGHRVCRVVLPWAQDTVLGCPRPPTTSAISSPTAARPKPRAKRPGRRLS